MINISKYLLLIYLLLKPYYLFSSGAIQPSDMLLLLSALLFFTAVYLNSKNRRSLWQILDTNKLLLVFIASTFVINGIYFLITPEFKFLLSSIYFVFNLLVVIIFSAYYKDKIFLSRVSLILKVNLLLQFVIWATGLGRYYSFDRYMGTFNDPNQFGFYVFISLLLIFVIEILLERNRKNIFYWVLGIFLIILTASTGMLLGLAVFFALLLFYGLSKLNTIARIRRIMFGVVGLVLIILAYLGINNYIQNTSQSSNISGGEGSSVAIIDRISTKFSKAEGDADITIWEDRGYDIIYKYPQYLILGAGEGDYDRYPEAANNFQNEVHATLPSILFYYGILPFIILLAWFYKTLRAASLPAKIAVAALLVESMTLINQRQSLFWLLIVLAGFTATTLINKKHEEKNNE